MARLKIIIPSLLIIFHFGLISCIKEVDKINYNDPSPIKLFVYCVLTPGNPIVVKVMKTKPFFNGSNFDENVKNAHVTVYDDNNKITLEYNPITGILPNNYFLQIDPRESYYYGDTNLLKILPGKTYHLSIKTQDGLTATAHCTIPTKLAFKGMRRLPDEQIDTNTILYPFEIDWDLGANKIQCMLVTNSVDKRITNSRDTVSYQRESTLGWLIYPEQTANQVTIGFGDFQRLNVAFQDKKITSVKLIVFDHNLYEAYIKSRHTDNRIDASSINPEGNRFYFQDVGLQQTPTEIRLPVLNILPGSVTVAAGGLILKEDVDYILDYTLRMIKIINQDIVKSGFPITYRIKSENGDIVRTEPANYTYDDDAEGIPFEDNLFSEPIIYYTNIEGGYGIFGASVISEVLVAK